MNETKKFFAVGDSEGPNLANLQLEFWRLAVERFKLIERKLQEFGTEDGEESEDYEGAEDYYDHRDFVIDAVVALMLAGTSVSELLGQNSQPGTKGRIPSPVEALDRLIPNGVPSTVADVPDDIRDRLKSFIDVYDALRHFGESKYETVKEITQEALCGYLKTAQDVWKLVLQLMNDQVTTEFRCEFRLA